MAIQWHFDKQRETLERLIHYKGYRFNQKGKLVEHWGESYSKKGEADALKYLMNKKSDFFKLKTTLIVIPCDWQKAMGLPEGA